jgi:hypothetical protein
LVVVVVAAAAAAAVSALYVQEVAPDGWFRQLLSMLTVLYTRREAVWP